MMYTSIHDKFVDNYMVIHVFFSLWTRIPVNCHELAISYFVMMYTSIRDKFVDNYMVIHVFFSL